MHKLLKSSNFSFFTAVNLIVPYKDKKQKLFAKNAVKYYEGDWWNNGQGYIGPIPSKDNEDRSSIIKTIRESFVSRNVLKEVLDRAVDGLLSKSPDWKIYSRQDLINSTINAQKRREQIQQRLDMTNRAIDNILNGDVIDSTSEDITEEKVDPRLAEAEVIINLLWEEAGIGEFLKNVITEELNTSKGAARYYIPYKFIEKGFDDKKTEFVDVIKYVKLEKLDNAQLSVSEDEGDKLSVAKIEINDLFEDRVISKENIEISFTDDDDKTYLAILDDTVVKKGKRRKSKKKVLETIDEIIENLEQYGEVSDPISLDGNLFHYEFNGEPLTTEQLIQNNKALNLALSLGVNVLVEGGFPEMATTNVEFGNDETIKRGPRTLNNFIGQQSVTAEGEIQFQDPGVFFKDPTTLKSFIEGESLYYRQCLSEGKQLFVLISADALASGESRIQARQDFLKKIQRYKPGLDRFGSWVLTTGLHLVAALAGKDGHFEGLQVAFDSKIYAGELSADEKNVVISQYEKGLISRESAVVLLGTEDPIIEIDMIRADKAEAMFEQIKKLAAVSRYSQQIQSENAANGDTNPNSDPVDDRQNV